MGCASSSPLITANGKVLDAAKNAASDAMHAQEDALNDLKATVTETAENVKEAVVSAVQNVGHGIESAISGNKHDSDHDIQDIGVMDISNDDTIKSKQTDDPNFKHIPLKDPTKTTEMDTALDKLTETINNKSKEYQDEAEKLTDDLIKETDDILTDTIETTNQQVTKSINQILVRSSPVHSVNSLETNSPEPEIEKAMANETKMNPPTPKPTFSELERLHSDITASIVNTGMGLIDLTTSSHIENSATTTTSGSNGQVLVSAEINAEDIINEDENELDNTINESDSKSPENDKDFDFNDRKLSVIEETAWEKLADQIVKLPINKLQAYREVALTTSARSSSVDNIFKHSNYNLN